jgi:hypothetical protein
MTERKTTSAAAKSDKANDEEDSSRLDNDGAPAQQSRRSAARDEKKDAPDKDKHPTQARQEAEQEKRNQEQALSSETPASDPSPHPQASDSANLVDQPGRAHTLSYDEETGESASLGERLKAARDTEQLEIRPKTHPGFSSDHPNAGYDVALELRTQWPGIKLGDDEEPDKAAAADKK